MSPLLPEVDLFALSERITERLTSVRRAMRRHFVAEGLAILTAVLVAAAGLMLLLDWQLELSRTSRWICLAAVVGVLGYLAHRHVVRPLLMPLTPLDVAAAIDRSKAGPTRVDISTRVASVLELPRQVQAGESVSAALVSRAVAESYQELEHVNFQRHLNRRHWWISLGAIAGCLLIPAAFAAAAPGIAKLWRDRWLLGSDRPWPHSTVLRVLNVENGRLVVPRGEPSSLQVEVIDTESPTQAVWMRLKSQDGNTQTVALNRFADGDFRYDLPPQQQPLDVELWGGDGRAEPFRIEPLDRPKITTLKLSAKHPREAASSTFVFTGEEGNVRLLPRTDAVLEFETNVPIATVKVEADGDSPRSFERISDRKFSTKWVHNGPVKMRVSLLAADSSLESYPRPITIGDKADRPPTLSVRHSGVRLRVTSKATIPLSTSARDDYGVRSIELLAAVDAAGSLNSAPEEPAAEGTPSADDAASPDEVPGAEEKVVPDAAPPAEGEQPDPPAAVSGEVTQSVVPGNLQFTALLQEESSEPAEPAGSDSASEEDPEAVFEDDEDPKAAPAKPLPTEVRTRLFGPVDPALELSVEPKHDVELSQLNVVPGQSVSITVAAEDDCYTGRQIAQSRKLVFKVVKDEELFKEILLRQQQLRARLGKAYDQMVDLHTKLKSADVQADGSTLLRTYLLVRREIGAVARELDASVQEMRLNKLGGAESWNLIETTVLEPLNRLQSQELERQKQALETFTGSQPEPLEEVIERQQAIVDGLKKILDNMSQWDSFIDIVNQVNSIIKIQEKARKLTDELKEKQVESIFDQ